MDTKREILKENVFNKIRIKNAVEINEKLVFLKCSSPSRMENALSNKIIIEDILKIHPFSFRTM